MGSSFLQCSLIALDSESGVPFRIYAVAEQLVQQSAIEYVNAGALVRIGLDNHESGYYGASAFRKNSL
ncbi:MAG: hypothetical protein GY790_12595 [Bacteroidetes bacterium]|nr:hypothetical protein [Bacteroidota bacterium]